MAALTARNQQLLDQALAELARYGGPMTTLDVAINLNQEGFPAERDVWRALDRLAGRGLIARLPQYDGKFVAWQIIEGDTPMTLTVREWNERHPIGTRVKAYPGDRAGRCLDTVTRSRAWTLPGGQDVVLVRGAAGGIALTHVDPEVDQVEEAS